jgi:hypothetical protein
MNDRVELGGPCACGSSFRTLRRVLGRNDDVLQIRRMTPDQTTGATTRAVFPDLVSRWIITTDDSIREFRVTVFTPDALEVVLDLLPGTSGAEAERVREAISLRLQEEFAFFDSIVRNLSVRLAPIHLPLAMQKYRRFVNLTPRQALERALVRIARSFAAAGVSWGVCSSMLLALRGLPVEPHDIDLLVSNDGFEAACSALEWLGGMKSPARVETQSIYGTRRFAEYEIDGVDVDVMAGLVVIGPYGEYDYELTEGSIDRMVPMPETAGNEAEAGSAPFVPLTSLEDWFVLYQLIPGRAAKVDIIERALREEPPTGAERIFALERLRASLGRALPLEVARRVESMLRFLESVPEAMV